MINVSRTVLIGGFVLTTISGIVNAVGFLSFAHQGLTHLTGITSHISLFVSNKEFDSAIKGVVLILSFVIGAVVSGYIVQKSNLKLGRNYGYVLIIESILLFLAIDFLNRQSFTGECLVASACGLQNAMASTYAGSILRTTHLTGVFTDLGIWIGHYLKNLTVDSFAIKIYFILIVGFFLGGVLGVFLFNRFEYYALIFPGSILCFSGILYTYLAHFKQENA